MQISSSVRLLIVSDNAELCEYLHSLVNGSELNHRAHVTFCFSPRNTAPEALYRLGAELINLTDEGTIDRVLREFDIIFSLHCKQLFPKRLVENITCINVHPGLNPYNRGWYPQVFSILNGLPAGATIHVMDSKVDHGAIVAQRQVSILLSDTSLDVYRRVIAAEKDLLREYLPRLLHGTFTAEPPAVEGNYNSVADFRRLCELDLRHIGTLEEHLRLLRATTHGKFRNAFYTDDQGHRYFVRVCIDTDSRVESK